MTDTHPCPGGCHSAVNRGQLACKPCWFRLPAPFRNAVNRAWRGRGRPGGTDAYLSARQAAVRWYADHPLPGGEHRG